MLQRGSSATGVPGPGHLRTGTHKPLKRQGLETLSAPEVQALWGHRVYGRPDAACGKAVGPKNKTRESLPGRQPPSLLRTKSRDRRHFNNLTCGTLHHRLQRRKQQQTPPHSYFPSNQPQTTKKENKKPHTPDPRPSTTSDQQKKRTGASSPPNHEARVARPLSKVLRADLKSSKRSSNPFFTVSYIPTRSVLKGLGRRLKGSGSRPVKPFAAFFRTSTLRVIDGEDRPALGPGAEVLERGRDGGP